MASKPFTLFICMLITIIITIWSAKTLMKNQRTKGPQQTGSSLTDLYKEIEIMTNLAKRYVPCKVIIEKSRGGRFLWNRN